MRIEFGFALPADGEHLLATPWRAYFISEGGKALSPGCGAYCSPAAAEIKPVRTLANKNDCRTTG